MGSFVQLTYTETTEKYKYINNIVRFWAPFWTIGHWKFVPTSHLVGTASFLDSNIQLSTLVSNTLK
jgi:hypothetical protein